MHKLLIDLVSARTIIAMQLTYRAWWLHLHVDFATPDNTKLQILLIKHRKLQEAKRFRQHKLETEKINTRMKIFNMIKFLEQQKLSLYTNIL